MVLGQLTRLHKRFITHNPVIRTGGGQRKRKRDDASARSPENRSGRFAGL